MAGSRASRHRPRRTTLRRSSESRSVQARGGHRHEPRLHHRAIDGGPLTATAQRIAAADEYLANRTGRYEWRCIRYDAALQAMHAIGLDDDCTVMDVGSGWGEFGVRLHTGSTGWAAACDSSAVLPGDDGFLSPSRARYIPIDAGNDGTDLEDWRPPRDVDYIVALEVVEHVKDPAALIGKLQMAARRGIIISTPNPATTDVLGMDPTHKVAVGRYRLLAHGFTVEARSFYGGVDDSLFAVWDAVGMRRVRAVG